MFLPSPLKSSSVILAGPLEGEGSTKAVERRDGEEEGSERGNGRDGGESTRSDTAFKRGHASLNYSHVFSSNPSTNTRKLFIK